MAIGAGATLTAQDLHATLGANSTSMKVGVDNLLTLKQSLDPYTPEQMISTDVDGLGLDMSLEEAQEVKTALNEVVPVNDLLLTSGSLRRTWGLGV